MNVFKKIKINQRINLFVIGLLIIIFSVVGVYLYHNQKERILQTVKQQMNMHLDDLINVLEVQINEKQYKVNSSLKIADYILNNEGRIVESDTGFIRTHAVNQLTKIERNVLIPKWYINGELLQNNHRLVDKIKQITNETSTIFQKIPGGFLRISTNVMNDENERAVGTYIPNSSPVVKTVEQGNIFRGRAYVVNDWYLTAYQPIYIDNQIKGMLYVGVKEKDYALLKDIFSKKKYFESGYPFILDKNGKLVIHPTLEDENISNRNLFKRIKQAETNTIRYKWPENKNGKWKQLYFQYFEPFEAYVVTSVYEEELFQPLYRLQKVITISILISIIVFSVGIMLIIRPIIKGIKRLVKQIGDLSKGKSVQKIQYERDDEIGEIVDSLNVLIDGLKETTAFSKEIGKGNLDAGFRPLSEADELGNSLLEMRKSLKTAREEEKKRKQEDQKRNWTTQGLANFADILREDNNDIHKLSYNAIKNLVKYVDANQGGLFIVNDNDPQNKFIELMACFAYNRKKSMEKQIKIGEGLVGRCVAEGNIIHLTEIPENYVNITSGLGEELPRSLLIVPLKLNEEVFGVIEMASFTKFQQYQIDFVEKVGENIASTLSSTKINMRTAKLLEQSKEQAEEMAAQEEELRQNIEEMITTQEEAEHREAKAHGFVDAVNHTFIRADFSVEGKLKYANSIFLETLGYSHFEEIKQWHINSFLQMPDVSKFNIMWNKIARGGKHFEGELNFRKKEGNVWLMSTFTAVRDKSGNPVQILFLAINIDSAKKQYLKAKSTK